MTEKRPNSQYVGVRVPLGLIEMIDRDIEDNGEHATRTQWIIDALRAYADMRGLRRGGGGLTPNSILLWGFFRCFSVNISIIMVLYDHFLGVYDQI